MSAATESSGPQTGVGGARCRLEPLTVGHYDELFVLLVRAERHQRWRLRGAVPSPERFVQIIWADVIAQFAVVQSANSTVVGLLQIHEADLRSGHAQVTLIVADELRNEAWPLEALQLGCRYAFESWDLRKLYIQVLESRLDMTMAALEPIEPCVEGRLFGHEYSNGAYEDLVQLAIRRVDVSLEDVPTGTASEQ